MLSSVARFVVAPSLWILRGRSPELTLLGPAVWMGKRVAGRFAGTAAVGLGAVDELAFGSSKGMFNDKGTMRSVRCENKHCGRVQFSLSGQDRFWNKPKDENIKAAVPFAVAHNHAADFSDLGRLRDGSQPVAINFERQKFVILRPRLSLSLSPRNALWRLDNQPKPKAASVPTLL